MIVAAPNRRAGAAIQAGGRRECSSWKKRCGGQRSAAGVNGMDESAYGLSIVRERACIASSTRAWRTY